MGAWTSGLVALYRRLSLTSQGRPVHDPPMAGSRESHIRSLDARPDSPDPSESRRPIELTVAYERLNAFFADYTKNISRGGTFIHTRRPLPVGTEFLFLLFIPTLERPLEIRGRVDAVLGPRRDTDRTDGAPIGMGITFVYDSDEDRRQLERAVERLMVDNLGHLVYRKLMARVRDAAS
jgi:type IV pilus assembly protein PilZ